MNDFFILYITITRLLLVINPSLGALIKATYPSSYKNNNNDNIILDPLPGEFCIDKPLAFGLRQREIFLSTSTDFIYVSIYPSTTPTDL